MLVATGLPDVFSVEVPRGHLLGKIHRAESPFFIHLHSTRHTLAPEVLVAAHPEGVILFTEPMLRVLSDVQFGAIAAHEYGHAILGHRAFKAGFRQNLLAVNAQARIQECQADHFSLQFDLDAPRHLMDGIDALRRLRHGDSPPPLAASGRWDVLDTHPRDEARRALAGRTDLAALASDQIRFSAACEPTILVPSGVPKHTHARQP